MAKHTYGPWFFNYVGVRPIIQRQRFSETGKPMAYAELDGDFSKLLKLLEVTGRAAGLEGIPSFGNLGAAASDAYGRATSALADPPPRTPLPRPGMLDAETAAIVAGTGRLPIAVDVAYNALHHQDTMWIYDTESAALGLDPWKAIDSIRSADPHRNQFYLLNSRRDGTEKAVTVSGDFIIYYRHQNQRAAA